MARKVGSTGEATSAAAREAALKLFARSGYGAVTMRALAAEIGVQPAALYNYWSTKQDLLLDLLSNHMAGLAEAADAEGIGTVAAGDDPVAALETFVRFHIRYHLDRPDAVFLSYMELRALEPDNFASVETARRAYERRLRRILEVGVERGAFAVGDVKVAAMALIAMLTGVNTWYRSGGRLSPRRIEEVYVEMAARSVGARAGDNEQTAAPVANGEV